jgi:Tol biopolymer transport system component
MGEVYRAKDARLDRIVAIKVLPASFSSDHDRMQRFAQEARAAAALNHPNILSIFDIGEENGSPYVVSELLEGETLRERLRSGALSTRKAIDYGLQVARGLAAAHEKGIVHRDLKPENMFITSDGRVKILDFGLAKLIRPEAESSGDALTVHAVTEPGLIMGTAGYMSPEQVRGQVADPRADIFAFGAILYEMISGKRAFHGETSADTMSAILKEEVPDLSETARNVPAALERIVRHCLEKNPSQRFHSAGDVAFDLESLTEISATGSKSGAQAEVAQAKGEESRRKLLRIAAIVALSAAMISLGWWLGRGRGAAPPAEYQQITFRNGSIGNARFTPDGSIVYDAAWDSGERQLYLARTDDNGARELGMNDATLLSISKKGELAIRLNTVNLGGYARSGTLARVPLSGGTPREVLENVGDADWAVDSENMAVVRFVPENSHWRLEYPIGKVLLDTINWISNPKISADGKLVAFADHENTEGDDEGSVAVIDMDGHEKKLASGFVSLEGVEWSATGDELWFTATRMGSAENLHGVTLAGKERSITNFPGGMWFQDQHDGLVLMVSHQIRIGIRGLAPGAKEERELGWLGWSVMTDISRDGKKVLFDEEGDGGGPSYTVFIRDTDGPPPVRIGNGTGEAISPDNKWVITRPAKSGALYLVPTGAGEARQLTHDNINYGTVRYFPDGKQLLADGIEAGHGARDYLIDLSTGNAKPVTPEGVVGTRLSPDGRSVPVLGPDGKWSIWLLDGGAARPIPDLDSKYRVAGWSPDGASVYASSSKQGARTAPVYRVNVATGKMELWKTLGEGVPTGSAGLGSPRFSNDGTAYAYVYSQVLSHAYVVKGLQSEDARGF